MVAHYLSTNSDFVATEMRGIKMQRSARDSYGDDAIGYVQVKRVGDVCTVKCRITPEHRVRTTPYHCSLECNEKDGEVLNVTCEDCAASRGGCKHTIAFLMWLHRRSEEPSTTATKCYWKKSKLSGIGTTLKMIKAKDFGTSGITLHSVGQNGNIFFDQVALKLRELQIQCSLSHFICEKKEVEKMSIHYLINRFKKSCVDFHFESFITFCKNEMTESRCHQVKEGTTAQSDSNLWFEMRYGRITASKMYEAAQCTTKDGSLVEEIFGAVTFNQTNAIKRGKKLEKDVIKEVSKLHSIKIVDTGLFLKNEWPMIGASPDGLTDDCVLEVKCPTKANTFTTYCSKEYSRKVNNKSFWTKIVLDEEQSDQKTKDS
ncbi:uncharacterized protein LOC125065885 [Vanessa atalanta]|uniref:uncharacterized protein LOC125065885 n=1 Tax=Vanessa atalanta TaxID=42275 RepID=UPI001FCD670D|nr:uncharacterized protein LOC125065885 [Vanessa atalanta]